MTTYTISAGFDTNLLEVLPTTSLGTSTGIAVKGSPVGQRRIGLVYLPLPSDILGATIASATLTGHSGVTSWLAATLGVNRVAGSWSDSTATWSGDPGGAGTAENTSVSAGSGVGTPIVLTVTNTVQAVAAGAAWNGFRITSSSVNTTGFQSFESSNPTAWTLTIVISEVPEVPTALVPNGTVVASSKPVLSCDFTDNGGLSTDMGAIRVQIDPAQNGVSPAYDSGIVPATLPIFDLSSPPPPAPAFTAMASGSTTYWRVQVQDTSALTSGFSDWAAMTYRPQPTLTLLTPAAGVLWDPTSDILASTSANMSAYRVQVTDGTDRTAIRFDSGRLPANPSALTSVRVSLPEEYLGRRVLVDDRDYQLHVRVWDTNLARQSTPGSPSYVDSWSTFHFDDDLTQTPISTLTASQPEVSSPAVQLTWTRASAPDGWIVLRDRSVIAKLDPADVISGVSTYSWTDPYPRPWVEHIYDVRPTTLVSGVSKRAKAGPLTSITPEALGIHIYTEDGQHVIVDAGDVSQLQTATRLATHKPLNVRYDTDVVTGFEGLSGTFTGGVIPSALDDSDVLDVMAVFESIRRNPSAPVKLVFGLFSGRVLLRNVSVTPHPQSNRGVPLMSVAFGVNQVADFDQA